MKKYKTIAILLSLVLFLPLFVSAAGLIPCNGTPDSPCDFNAFSKLINGIINWFIGISATVAAITFSIAGGQMLLNPDNPSKREEAINMFKKTVYGMIIILVAWLVVHTVVATLVDPNTNALRFFGK